MGESEPAIGCANLQGTNRDDDARQGVPGHQRVGFFVCTEKAIFTSVSDRYRCGLFSGGELTVNLVFLASLPFRIRLYFSSIDSL